MSRVALVSKKYKESIDRVVNSVDQYTLTGSVTVGALLSDSIEKNKFFDRLLIMGSAVAEGKEQETFINLVNYINSYVPNLQVVLAVNKGKHSDMVDYFESEFNSPLYTVVYLPEKTSISLLVSLIKDDILELRARYYEIDRGVSTPKTSPKSKEGSKKETKKSKKRGLFSRIFGKKEEEAEEVDEPSEEVVIQPVKEVEVEVPAPVETTPSTFEEIYTPELPKDNPNEQLIKNVFSLSNDTDEDSETETGSLSFGIYGESHAQTGYIEDEDDLPISVNTQNDSWSSVEDINSGSGVSDTYDEGSSNAEIPSSSKNVEFSQKSDLEYPSVENLGSQLPINSIQTFDISSVNLSAFSVTLVVGDYSSEFLANYLKERKGFLVIDTDSYGGLLPYIDAKSYYQSTNDYYEEVGNLYQLGVEASRVQSIISKNIDRGILVNVPIDMVDAVVKSISSKFEVVVVLGGGLPKLESQILKFEGLSPVTSRAISKGSAYVLENVDLSLIRRGIYSRINWKGLIL